MKKPKPQRFWAVVDAQGLVCHAWWLEDGTMRIADSKESLTPGDDQRIVRVEVRVVEPKPRKRKARKGAK